MGIVFVSVKGIVNKFNLFHELALALIVVGVGRVDY